MTERLFSSVVIGLWENSRQRGYLGGPWAAYFWSSSRLTPWLDKRLEKPKTPHVEGHSVSKANEWELIRRQFDALTYDESVESIEDIFDAQFRRRFTDLINQIAQPDSMTGSIDSRPRQRWLTHPSRGHAVPELCFLSDAQLGRSCLLGHSGPLRYRRQFGIFERTI